MSAQTGIQWCDSTFNPWIGCTKIGPGCDHCYAESRMDSRLHVVKWGAGSPRKRTSVQNWKQPVKWNATPLYECACGYRGTLDDLTTNTVHGCGLNFKQVRRRVFCASLADVFDNEVDPQWRAGLWELIARTPNLDWLLLTKRIGNVKDMLPVMDSTKPGYRPWNFRWPWSNVWLGATVVNQDEADRDIPKLLATPAAVRFLSIEPMLGLIDLRRAFFGLCREHDFPGGFCIQRQHKGVEHIHWVIAGGESGTHARPAQPEWFRSLRDQCATASVPFLFKQWGEHAPNWLNDNHGNKIPDSEWMDRIGKKAAGRLLDGIEHNGFPGDTQ